MAQAATGDQAIREDPPGRRSLGGWPGWNYVPGIASIVVGILALAVPPLAGIAASLYVGAMLCVAGAFTFVGGVANIRHRGGWIALVLGLLSLAAGLIAITNPVVGAISLVWVMGIWLIAGGISELVMGFNIAAGRGWLILVSLVNILLGIFLLMLAPRSAFAFLGYFVGISLFLQGLWSLMFTAELRRAGRSAAPTA